MDLNPHFFEQAALPGSAASGELPRLRLSEATLGAAAACAWVARTGMPAA